jgi:hypothetical protein
MNAHRTVQRVDRQPRGFMSGMMWRSTAWIGTESTFRSSPRSFEQVEVAPSASMTPTEGLSRVYRMVCIGVVLQEERQAPVGDLTHNAQGADLAARTVIRIENDKRARFF